MENFFDLLLCYYLMCQGGNNHFDVHFRRIRPVFFPSKGGIDAVREGRNGRRGVYFRQSRHFPFINDMIKVLFPICTLIGRVNKYVSYQGKV